MGDQDKGFGSDDILFVEHWMLSCRLKSLAEVHVRRRIRCSILGREQGSWLFRICGGIEEKRLIFVYVKNLKSNPGWDSQHHMPWIWCTCIFSRPKWVERNSLVQNHLSTLNGTRIHCSPCSCMMRKCKMLKRSTRATGFVACFTAITFIQEKPVPFGSTWWPCTSDRKLI